MNRELLESLVGQHPAREMSFDELYRGILSRAQRTENQKPLINLHEHNGLVLANYSHECVYSRAWDVFTCISRGLILDPENKKVVATPFPKFFNLGEHECHWRPEGEMLVQMKMDGCLGIIYFHEGKWKIASRGSLDSDVARSGQKMLDEKYDTSHFNVGETYIVEILSKDHRIIVPYDYEDLVILSSYDELGFENNWLYTQEIALNAKMPFAEVFQFDSVDAVVEHVAGLPYTEEGFVVRFANGYRVKIKGAAYLEKHKALFSFGPLRVWEMLLHQEDLDTCRRELPEEYWDEFDRYVNEIMTSMVRCLAQVEAAYDKTSHLTNKDLGLCISKLGLTEVGRKYVFPRRANKFYTEFVKAGSVTRRKFFGEFRPKHNMLDSEKELDL